MRWSSIAIGWLVLLAGIHPSHAQIFPKEMSFRVKGEFVLGSFRLSFGEELVDGRARYSIVLRDFGGLGMTSSQELWSYVFQDDLSLYGHFVREQNGQTIRQVFLNEACTSAMGRVRTTCFDYREEASSDRTQTEIFADGRAIDLLSSILVATRLTADGARKTTNFVFIFEDHARKVSLVPTGREWIELDGERRKTTIWSMRPRGEAFELYRFYIARDTRGRFFPARMMFVDPGRGRIEFHAEAPSW